MVIKIHVMKVDYPLILTEYNKKALKHQRILIMDWEKLHQLQKT